MADTSFPKIEVEFALLTRSERLLNKIADRSGQCDLRMCLDAGLLAIRICSCLHAQYQYASP